LDQWQRRHRAEAIRAHYSKETEALFSRVKSSTTTESARASQYGLRECAEWLQRDDAFAIDPTSLPLQRGVHHSGALFGRFKIVARTVGGES